VSRIRIDVPEDVIANACQKDSTACMVAEAIKRKYPDASRVTVDTAHIRYSRRGKRYIFLTPMKAMAAIVMFDEGDKPKPFSFSMEPIQTVKAGKKPKAKVNPKTGKKVYNRKKLTKPAGNSKGTKLGTGRSRPHVEGGDTPKIAPLANKKPGPGGKKGKRGGKKGKVEIKPGNLREFGRKAGPAALAGLAKAVDQG
jgi:hypothetical protein